MPCRRRPIRPTWTRPWASSLDARRWRSCVACRSGRLATDAGTGGPELSSRSARRLTARASTTRRASTSGPRPCSCRKGGSRTAWSSGAAWSGLWTGVASSVRRRST
eukprot:3457374-Alexandrium_andersonii.AAC.1